VWGGADERSHRNVPVSPASHVPLYPVFPDPFGEGVLEGRRERRGGEAPKEYGTRQLTAQSRVNSIRTVRVSLGLAPST